MNFLLLMSFPLGVVLRIVYDRENSSCKFQIQKLHIKGDPPPKLPKTSYFNRFEDSVLENRREACLKLLQHAGSNQILYSSQVFVEFLSDPNCSDQATLSPSIDSEDENEDRTRENTSSNI